MTTTAVREYETLQDVIDAAGGVCAERILLTPKPGTATEADVIAFDRLGLSYELVNGILLKKPMGNAEDRVAVYLRSLIWVFVDKHNLGVVGGAMCPMRLAPGLVRMPDAYFITWGLIQDEVEGDTFRYSTPELIIEVLSPHNPGNDADIIMKLGDYSRAGVKLAWYVDSVRKEVDVYDAARLKSKKTLTMTDTLSGGKVLPGFELPLKTIFEDRRPPKPKKKA